jgi:hypothetical protein
MIQARMLAYEKASHEVLAQILDGAELLPMLMAEDTDQTTTFRDMLVDLAQRHRELVFALERFDREK